MTSRSAAGAFLLVGAHAVEVSVLVAALTLYRRGDRGLRAFLAAPVGWACLIALLVLVVSVPLLVYLARLLPPPRMRRLTALVVLNLFSVTLAFGVAEAIVRVLATPAIQGPVFAGTVLLPYRWEDATARGRATLERAAIEQSYLVHDGDLGWTIGPNRASKDYNRQAVEQYLARVGRASRRRAPADADGRIYVSSAEGLRSPRPGMSFAALPAKRRIAVVGDSFTFGLEVRYEETWAHQLEQALGSEVQVLNFGVDGYGVDQAYLRYRRDVLAWHPEIVILGMIDDDLRRTMCVYGFLCFSGFGIPFSKPRLVLTDHGLAPLNLPLPAPDSLFAKRSIADLPFIEFDVAFDPRAWQWRFYHHSYAIRFALSRYHPWTMARPPVTREVMKSLNAEVVRAFVKLAREHGSTPIVAFFPSNPDPAWAASRAPNVADEVLAAKGIRYFDLTGCVEAVPAPDRFVALHYSARTNAAVARCLRDAIAAGFESSDEGGGRR